MGVFAASLYAVVAGSFVAALHEAKALGCLAVFSLVARMHNIWNTLLERSQHAISTRSLPARGLLLLLLLLPLRGLTIGSRGSRLSLCCDGVVHADNCKPSLLIPSRG